MLPKRLFRTLLFSLCVVNSYDTYAAPLDELISPMTDPVNFEDPRSTTEIRPIYLYHSFDKKFITAGGNVRVYAVQARLALTDRLSLIATKDGIVDFNPRANLSDENGFGNLSAGLKYAYYVNEQAGHIAAVALRYEAPTGEKEVFQGTGDGFIQPSTSATFTLGNNYHLIASTDLRIPNDSKDSFYWDADIQLDKKIDTGSVALYPLIGLNLMHVADGGKRLPLKAEGADYFNFGSSNASGSTVVTGAVGARVRFNENVDWGIGYQVPLTSGAASDVFNWRITTDFIFRFC